MYRYLPRACTLLLFVLLTLAGCGDAEPDRASDAVPPGDTTAPAPAPGSPEPEGAAVPLPALVDAGLGREPGQDERPLLDRLPEPDRVEAEPRQNRHDPSQTDTLRTLYYDGLQLTVYDVSASGRALLQNILVTGRGYETEEGLQVGSTRQEVEAALGPPDQEEGAAYVYELSEVTPNRLVLRFDGDQVSEMEWQFYVD